MAAWTLVGNEENWVAAFRQGAIWGVREKYRNLWERLGPDDLLLFYCKSPVAGIIGVGTHARNFKQDKPFWPDEEREGRVIYPYRLEMNVIYVLPEAQWRSDAIKGSFVGLSRGYVAKGLNPIRAGEILQHVENALRTKFGVTLGPVEPKKVVSDHATIQDILVELGTLQRFLSHKEYPMDRERLDVVWRRVERSVPTYVFEVQVGGDIHHALGKLKHAYDLWNSNVVLALPPEDKAKAENLLSGTFHEVRDKVKLVDLARIQELYQKKKEWKALERSLGIF
jgi:predicted RNA-binding protein